MWEDIRLCLLGCHHHPLPQQPKLHSLCYYAVRDEVPLGRFVRTLLRQLVQELLKSGPEFPVLASQEAAPPGGGLQWLLSWDLRVWVYV